MRLEHYSLDKIKKEIISIVGRRLDLASCRVFFFGSRVTGKGNERSDVDVGIERRDPVSSAAMLDILEDAENLPTLYKVDIVDFARVSKNFRAVVFEEGTESITQ